VTTTIVAYLKNKKLQQISIKLAFEKFTLSKRLESVMAENESAKLEKDEGFIRFLSQSRESAFKYIEEVQEAIDSYAKDNSQSNYDKLISFLPKEDEKR
jgi:phospholipid N-methyltransferase